MKICQFRSQQHPCPITQNYQQKAEVYGTYDEQYDQVLGVLSPNLPVASQLPLLSVNRLESNEDDAAFFLKTLLY